MAFKPMPSGLLAGIKLTDEQKAFCRSDGRVLVSNAFAGTGKTTQLVGYTKARPHKRFLYLAFNKALQVEASERFGSNVECRTTHSLAFPQFGAQYRSKLGNLKPMDIAQELGVGYRNAYLALETLNAYLSSTDRSIQERHIPEDARQGSTAGLVLDTARLAWQSSKDISSRLAMPHDGYLKMFALSEPKLLKRYDTILFDECQDANPVTTEIVTSQRGCQIVMVGDRYQGIYGFRGAVNAMEEMTGNPEAEVHYLTKSFRFGAGIAGLASMILSDFCGEEVKLSGLGRHQTTFKISRDEPHASLCRTNGGIFQRAVDALERKEPFCLLGGIDGYNFERVLDVHRLRVGEKGAIRDSFLRRFESYEHASDYADQANDVELSSWMKIVDKYRDDIPGLVEDIGNEVLPDSEQGRAKANVVMTTAHKSKGLEFDNVWLEDDFSELMDQESGTPIAIDSREKQEEIHLLYVAVTRAKKGLRACSALKDYARWRKQNQQAMQDEASASAKAPQP